jgi:hypothetical protein
MAMLNRRLKSATESLGVLSLINRKVNSDEQLAAAGILTSKCTSAIGLQRWLNDKHGC